MKKVLKQTLFSFLSVLFWIFVWYAAASVANRNLMFKIPLPDETFRIFWANLGKADFLLAVATSVVHIALGFLAAVVLGTVCGILAGNSRFFKTLSSPMLHLIRSVPVAAFIFVAYLWIPSDALPSFISMLMVLPIIWSHVESGLQAADVRFSEMGQVFGMNRKEIILRIRLPLVLPHLRNGCITGLGIAWKAGVAAEVICNPTGSIGAYLRQGKISIEYGEVFAVTLAVVLLSLLLEFLLKLFWKEKRYGGTGH